VTDFRYGEIFNNRLIPNFSQCTVRIIGLVVGIAHVGIGTASRGAQRNFAHTCVLTLHIDLLSQIFHLFSN